ncbi:MAPEG family protein [Coralliovum pocilloporae]|uniref:MAPEG family protein n=1 Tax=Coralliovum pocilloporae TaxID=3066369 RepID=UPI003307091C
MTTELTMLTWTAALTMVLWVPYILSFIGKYGLMDALTYKADDKPNAPWAERLKRAHYNAVENLVPFAALVITAHLAGVSNDTTALAATVYFWARLAHVIAYVSGVPFGRTLSFATGWFAMAAILLTLIG